MLGRCNSTIACFSFFKSSATDHRLDKIDLPPLPAENPPIIAPRHYKLRNEILSVLGDALVMMGYAGMVTAFLPTEVPWYANPFMPVSICASLSALSKFLEQRCSEERWLTKKSLSGFQAMLFTSVDFFTRDALLHEYSHALAALSSYENAKPRVTINPIYNAFSKSYNEGRVGITHYNNQKLTSFGRYIGEENAKNMISSAGMAGSYVFSLLALLTANILGDKTPQVTSRLRLSAVSSQIGILIYLVSSLINECSQESASDDACQLKNAGYPIEKIIFILFGMTALFQIVLSVTPKIVEKCRKHNEPEIVEDIENPSDITPFVPETGSRATL